MPQSVRILFLGDIVGTNGLAMAVKMMRSLASKYHCDCIIVNGENIADGKSLTKKHAQELFEAGALLITTGNHVWDRWDAKGLLAEERRIIRPANYPRENPGSGFGIAELENGVKIGVIQLQGRTYMQTIDCPFKVSHWAVDKVSQETRVILVDMHAEATAEKQTLARYLDGQVSAVLGTHTHVQTGDEQILPNGTGYITDVGMCGPYESVIGMRIDIAIKRFVNQTPYKYEIAKEEVRLAGVVLEIEVETGACLSIERFMFPEFTKDRKQGNSAQAISIDGVTDSPDITSSTLVEGESNTTSLDGSVSQG